jgi:hypothetical protein
MHQDIGKAIDLIDYKIAELQRAKRTLIEAFGQKIPSTMSLPGMSKGGRKETVIKLLQDEGPLTRAEIIEKAGIPKGTVATVLNDKKTFKSKKGKWHLIEKKEEREQEQKDLNPTTS